MHIRSRALTQLLFQEEEEEALNVRRDLQHTASNFQQTFQKKKNLANQRSLLTKKRVVHDIIILSGCCKEKLQVANKAQNGHHLFLQTSKALS